MRSKIVGPTYVAQFYEVKKKKKRNIMRSTKS